MNVSMQRPRVRRTRAIAIAVGAGALLLALLVWMRSGKIEPGLLEASRTAPNLPTDRVRMELVPEVRDLTGTLQSRTQIDAASRVTATVREVRVRAGAQVKAGEILVVLDSSDLSAELARARSQLSAATANLDRATKDEERFSALVKRGAVTEHEFDAVEAQYRAARAQRDAAKAQVRGAEGALAYTVVHSPIDGVIGERLVEPGDLAVPGKPLVTIYDPRAIRVELRVPEDMIRLVQVGSAIKVHVDATGQDLEGVVSEVVPEADPASRTFLVRAPLPLADNLRPGMFARAAFKVGDRRLLTVARAAIGDVGQLETVRVVRDGGVQLRQIATGRRYGERVEVLSGLNADDRVLLDRRSTRTHE